MKLSHTPAKSGSSSRGPQKSSAIPSLKLCFFLLSYTLSLKLPKLSMAAASSSRPRNNVTHIQPADTQVARLLSKANLCERLNISPRTLENMVNAGTFPPSVRVGKYVYWSELAVAEWQRRMFAAQEAWTMH